MTTTVRQTVINPINNGQMIQKDSSQKEKFCIVCEFNMINHQCKLKLHQILSYTHQNKCVFFPNKAKHKGNRQVTFGPSLCPLSINHDLQHTTFCGLPFHCGDLWDLPFDPTDLLLQSPSALHAFISAAICHWSGNQVFRSSLSLLQTQSLGLIPHCVAGQ